MRHTLKKIILPLWIILNTLLFVSLPPLHVLAAAGRYATSSDAERAEQEETADTNSEPISYDVSISWPSGSEIQLACSQVWNPMTHSYDGWDTSETPITVANTSTGGAPVRVTLSFSAVPNGISAGFTLGEKQKGLHDFRVTEDGQISFELPLSDGSTSADVYLSLTELPEDGWSVGGEYQQIGTMSLHLEPGESILDLDEEIWLEPEEALPEESSEALSEASSEMPSETAQETAQETTSEPSWESEESLGEVETKQESEPQESEAESEAQEPEVESEPQEPEAGETKAESETAPEGDKPEEIVPTEPPSRLPEVVEPPELNLPVGGQTDSDETSDDDNEDLKEENTEIHKDSDKILKQEDAP